MDTFVMPGHELIQEDWQSNFDDYAVRLQELVDDRALPPCYYDHPVVLAHGGAAPVFPCVFFGRGSVFYIRLRDRYLACESSHRSTLLISSDSEETFV